MKFIMLKAKDCTYKVNIEKVEIIKIYEDEIKIIFNDNRINVTKEGCYNFKEVKEIAENL